MKLEKVNLLLPRGNDVRRFVSILQLESMSSWVSLYLVYNGNACLSCEKSFVEDNSAHGITWSGSKDVQACSCPNMFLHRSVTSGKNTEIHTPPKVVPRLVGDISRDLLDRLNPLIDPPVHSAAVAAVDCRAPTPLHLSPTLLEV